MWSSYEVHYRTSYNRHQTNVKERDYGVPDFVKDHIRKTTVVRPKMREDKALPF